MTCPNSSKKDFVSKASGGSHRDFEKPNGPQATVLLQVFGIPKDKKEKEPEGEKLVLAMSSVEPVATASQSDLLVIPLQVQFSKEGPMAMVNTHMDSCSNVGLIAESLVTSLGKSGVQMSILSESSEVSGASSQPLNIRGSVLVYFADFQRHISLKKIADIKVKTKYPVQLLLPKNILLEEKSIEIGEKFRNRSPLDPEEDIFSVLLTQEDPLPGIANYDKCPIPDEKIGFLKTLHGDGIGHKGCTQLYEVSKSRAELRITRDDCRSFCRFCSFCQKAEFKSSELSPYYANSWTPPGSNVIMDFEGPFTASKQFCVIF